MIRIIVKVIGKVMGKVELTEKANEMFASILSTSFCI